MSIAARNESGGTWAYRIVVVIVECPSRALYREFKAPPSYKCGDCDAHGCKLWRDYQTFLEHQTLRCCVCAGKNQNEDVSDIDAGGMRSQKDWPTRTDQIGWLIPAIPTEENDTFWGYTSVPAGGVAWWKALPTLPSQAS